MSLQYLLFSTTVDLDMNKDKEPVQQNPQC